jgi:hypothetical protein
MVYFYPQQDTTKVLPPQDTTKVLLHRQDSSVKKDTAFREVLNTDSLPFRKKDSISAVPAIKKPVIEKSLKIHLPEDSFVYAGFDIDEHSFSSDKLMNHLFSKDTLKSEQIVSEPGSFRKDLFTDRVPFSADWIFWLFMVTISLFMWVQLFYKKYFSMLFKSAVNYHASSKLFTERNLLARRVSFVLNFLYTIILSFFIYLIGLYYQYFDSETETFNFFLILLNVIILISIIKVIFHKATAFIFNISNLINEYLHNNYVINKTLGIFLLPVTFAAFYTDSEVAVYFVWAGIVFFLISVIVKIFRSAEIILQNGVLNFYSILYLCTLEFLPIVIGYRFLKAFM